MSDFPFHRVTYLKPIPLGTLFSAPLKLATLLTRKQLVACLLVQCSLPIKLLGYMECLHIVYGLRAPIPEYVFVMKFLSI